MFWTIRNTERRFLRISRIKRADEETVHAATDKTKLQPRDVIQVVGTESGLDRFEPLIGQASDLDLMTRSGDATFRRVVVTEPSVLNTPLRELSLDEMYSTTVINNKGTEYS